MTKLLSREVTLERLRELSNCKVGDPMPNWLPKFDWGPAMSHLARSAVWHLERSEDYISQLRHMLLD